MMYLSFALSKLRTFAQEFEQETLESHKRVVRHLQLTVTSVLLTLNQIDAVGSQFEAELEMEITWKDDNLWRRLASRRLVDTQDHMALDLTQLTMIPALKFTNALDEVSISNQSAEVIPVSGIVLYKVKFSGSFSEVMELKRFPFDRQVLHINFQHDSAKQPKYNVKWSSDTAKPKQECNDREWRGYETKITCKSQIVGEQKMEVLGRAERLSEYFMWNVVFVLFLIVAMSFLTFVIPADNGTDRFGLNLTLVLTSITFKFTIAGYLPKTTYLTLLDKYVLVGFITLFFVVVENTVGAVLSTATARMVDVITASVLAFAWVVINVMMLVGTVFGIFRQKWSLVESSQEGISSSGDDP
eukprot:TRINITY_DN453_c0_g1_i5.p1 TRINITY_DN453_c0_g1~~TRINITY_DN453_c0_g1_i5.p1  ORF type:complete len:380 (+),score=86.62 TRINITY_DN453_c0_g1_i5:71-1141(+)